MFQSKNLAASFQNRDYRNGYVQSFFDELLAGQIKSVRESRGWTQADLAKAIGTSQPVISRFESDDYSSWSLNSLRRVAEALDVALSVKFVPFSEALREIRSFSPSRYNVAHFSSDLDLGQGAVSVASSLQTLAQLLDDSSCGKLSTSHPPLRIPAGPLTTIPKMDEADTTYPDPRQGGSSEAFSLAA